MSDSDDNKLVKLVRYELYAQNRGDKLVIKNIEQNNYFICTAREILENPVLLKGFSPEQAAQIVVIEKMEHAENEKIS